MHDIARKTTRISGHTMDDLQDMLATMAREPQPQIYSIKTIAIPEPSKVFFYRSAACWPIQAKRGERRNRTLVRALSSCTKPNRGRLSGSATSLTFGAQTGRGTRPKLRDQAHLGL